MVEAICLFCDLLGNAKDLGADITRIFSGGAKIAFSRSCGFRKKESVMQHLFGFVSPWDL